MTILRTNAISGVGTNGPVFDGSLEFNSQNYVILPKGTTGDRVGVGSTTGALRYNTDSNKVELYDGNQWVEVQSSRPDLNGGARGVFGGGLTLTPTVVRVNTIEYITISSTGNTQDFGDLSADKGTLTACSSSTRGVFGGGATTTPTVVRVNTIEYITISSTGNAQDFGDLSVVKSNLSACSSSTRGVFGGGYTDTPGATYLNVIEYITISSTGNTQDFGDLSVGKSGLTACSSSTRGVFGGGLTPTPAATYLNVIEYITISSTGNTQDFGDLSVGNVSLSACSSSTRGVFGGGLTNTPAATYFNTIEYITISSTGNTQDFGDLSVVTSNLSACSNAHGGL
jgi:hypothetical protein